MNNQAEAPGGGLASLSITIDRQTIDDALKRHEQGGRFPRLRTIRTGPHALKLVPAPPKQAKQAE